MTLAVTILVTLAISWRHSCYVELWWLFIVYDVLPHCAVQTWTNVSQRTEGVSTPARTAPGPSSVSATRATAWTRTAAPVCVSPSVPAAALCAVDSFQGILSQAFTVCIANAQCAQ